VQRVLDLGMDVDRGVVCDIFRLENSIGRRTVALAARYIVVAFQLTRRSTGVSNSLLLPAYTVTLPVSFTTEMSGNPSASYADSFETKNGECVLTYEPLDTQSIIKSVGDDAAGAIAVFIGTTRNSFKGRAVVRLEYHAYTSLAIKTMATILDSANSLVERSEHSVQAPVPALIRCRLHHRLGVVPVGEPSIVIAVSSPHRRESFQACEFILEEVKAKAQIWKREFYEGCDEDSQWKANVSA